MKWSVFLNMLSHPEKIYLLLATLFGLIFIFVTPPASIPDEPAHLVRVFRVAQGDLFAASKTMLPSMAAYNDLCELVGMDRSPQNLNKQFRNFLVESGGPLILQDKSSSYPPVPYLPAATIVKFLSYFQPNTAVYLYSARFVTFIAALLLTFYAIRIIPFGRWVMLVLALLPMRLYLMASFSPDALTTALAVLWIALIMNSMASEGLITPRKLVQLSVVGLALAFCKPMYTFLLALIFAIPFKKVNCKSMFLKVGFILLLLIVTVKIGMMVKHQYIPTVPSNPSIVTGTLENKQIEQLATGPSGSFHFLAAVDPAAQIAFLLHNPHKIVTVVVNGFGVYRSFILKSCVAVFGWANVYIINGLYWFGYLIVVLSSFLNEEYTVNLRYRFITLSVFISSLFIIPLSLYVFWTPVGWSYFHGVQGRYFAPFLPLLFLSLGRRWNLPYKVMDIFKIFILTVLVILSAVSIFKIYKSYYTLPPVKGVLELKARSNANGVAYLEVLEQKPNGRRNKWKNEGIVNIISSDNPLSYKFRLPGKPIKSIRLIFAATGNLNLNIYSAHIMGLDDNLIKIINLGMVQKNSAGKTYSDTIKSTVSTPLTINLDSVQPQTMITFEDTPFDLTNQ